MRKIPIGIQDFKELITKGFVYIDKTEDILDMVNMNKYYFLPRPRRFGKSLLCSTMKYLFLGEKQLFKGLYAENNRDWEQDFPVVYISFAGWGNKDEIEEYIGKYGYYFVKEKGKIIEKVLGEIEFTRLSDIVGYLYKKYKKQVVILIDEYDRPVLNVLQEKEKAERLREEFRDFYSGIKDIDSQVRFFFLTGITKILKMSIFSVLNNLQDLFYNPIAYKIIGYTQEELKEYFKEELKQVAEFNGLTEEESNKIIKQYYNGYNFGNLEDTVYNPWDMNNLMLNKMFNMYRSSTGIPSSVEEYVRGKGINVEEIIDKLYKEELIVNETDLNLEDLNTITAEVLFLTSGYMTVGKKVVNEMICKFPNKQVENIVTDYFTRLKYGKDKAYQLQSISKRLIEGIKRENKEQIKESVEEILTYIGNVSYEWYVRNPEGWLKTLLMMVINLTVDFSITEKHFIRGRSDIVLVIDGKKYLLEIKVDGDERQIKEQLKKYEQEANVLMGINWDRKKNEVKVT